LARDDPGVGIELVRFLSQAYDFKAVADYEIGPDAMVPKDVARAAITTAAGFVDQVAELLK
jgi:hypothetical protein